MMSSFFAGLNFLSPWLLLGLLGLPLLWYLLKITPPRPKKITFPAFDFLRDIDEKETSAHHTPWWLLLLRVCALAALIMAFSGPFLKTSDYLASQPSAAVFIFNNSWTSTAALSAMKNQAAMMTKEQSGQTQDTEFFVMQTARPAFQDTHVSALNQSGALDAIQNIKNYAWGSDFAALEESIKDMDLPRDTVTFYFDDGVQTEKESDFLRFLSDHSQTSLFHPSLDTAFGYLRATPASPNASGNMASNRLASVVQQNTSLRFIRTAPFDKTQTIIHYHDHAQIIGAQTLPLESEQEFIDFTPDIPQDLWADVTSIRIAGQNHAGGIYLLPPRPERQTVGIIGLSNETSHNYLDPDYYIHQALSPFHSVKTDNFDTLSQDASVIFISDSERLNDSDLEPIMNWVNEGGIIVRFADESLAGGRLSELTPVPLRNTGRSLQSALSWAKPQTINRFTENSPFQSLPISNDIEIKRQILAEPFMELGNYVWAEIEDGTPLITAKKTGDGWLILYHVGAQPDWSNLPLSGLFVEQLLKIIDIAQGTVVADNQGLANADFHIERRLDADQTLSSPKGYEKILPLQQSQQKRTLSDLSPAGIYGNGDASITINVGDNAHAYRRASYPSFITTYSYQNENSADFKKWFLIAALVLLFIDCLYRIYSGASWPLHGRKKMASVLFVCALFGFTAPASAQLSDADLASHSVLAYVITGNQNVDALSEAGLKGLVLETTKRTLADLAQVKGVDVERDDLSFYPLIYWPITPSQAPVSPQAAEKLHHYLANGGLILFDTRDGYQTNRVNSDLLRITRNMTIPDMTPIPVDHVLRRSFYLLNNFPGLYDSYDFWIAPVPETINDGVAPILVGNNDWASAWAVNNNNAPMIAIPTGGERQREMAYRFGVNLVLYTLTGNYKDDQIHIPFILERLDQ